MAKYVVFAETPNQDRLVSGGRLLDRIIGYLESLADRAIIEERITAAGIDQDSDIDLWFRGDEKIKKELAQVVRREGGLVIRARLLNEPELKQFTANLLWRYGLQHRIYEAELPFDE